MQMHQNPFNFLKCNQVPTGPIVDMSAVSPSTFRAQQEQLQEAT